MSRDLKTAVLDRDDFLQRVEGDMELARDLVELFLEDLPERMSDLRQALAGSNLELVHERAHSLKGSIANFSAHPAFEAARDLDELARSGIREGLDEAFARLENELQRAQRELKNLVKIS
ncbi:MAG: Hpt domain-containing protein [Myxococcota bacterium]